MSEATGDTAWDGLELVYPPLYEDVSEAVRIRLRAAPWWRALRRTARGACALALVIAALALLPPEPEPRTAALALLPPEPEPRTAALFAGLGLVAVLAAELIPVTTARSVFRAVRGQGEGRALVDESGGRWITRDTDTVIRWPMLPRYVETPRLFVLLTARGASTGFAYLPKSGLAGPADADRLRALLDRHLTRV
ncbi:MULTISPECIES: YcxB family protein [unclassified Streptomyces]|uniref:YcxB family protein n=1 Tax=unclassified Streptomyces TaxID=2593676 RepID=UPI0037FE8655